jgi:hypothetical protein
MARAPARGRNLAGCALLLPLTAMGKKQRVLANFDVQDFPSEIVLEAVA